MKDYLENSISNGNDCLKTKCPYDKCTFIVNKEIVSDICSQELNKRYLKFDVDDMIIGNKLLYPCQNANCSKVFKVNRFMIYYKRVNG